MAEDGFGPILRALQGTLSPDQATRHHAESTLKEFRAVDGFLGALFQLINTNEVDVAIRQSGSILFKNTVNASWEPYDGKSTINEQEKQFVRANILESLVKSHPQVRSQLCICVRAIAQADYPHAWPTILPQIQEALASGDPRRMYGGLLVLRWVISKYEFKQADMRADLNAIVDQLFPFLLSLFNTLLENDSVEAAEIQKVICRIFWSAIQFAMPPHFLVPANFQGWMTAFATSLARPVPAGQGAGEPTSFPGWKAKKWLCHILQRLFQRYGNPKLAGEGLKDFASQFLDKYARHFLGIFLQLIRPLSQGGYLTPRVLHMAITYLNIALSHAVTYKVLKPELSWLVFECLFPMLCFNEEDRELWVSDPHEYVRKAFDVVEDFYSPKEAAVNFIVDLTRLRTKDSLDVIVKFVVDKLTSYMAAPPEARDTCTKDGCLLIIGSLNKKLLQKGGKYEKQLEAMLVTHVLPEFQNPAGFLRARACWLFGCFAEEVPFKDEASFAATINSVLVCMDDPELPVQIQAACALRHFIQSEQATALLRPHLAAILDRFFRLMDQIGSEELVGTLELIIEKYEHEIGPYAANLCCGFAEAFIKMNNDNDEESALAACGCLRGITAVLEGVKAQPEVFAAVEGSLLPLLATLLEPDGIEFMDETLDIMAYLTFYSTTISPHLWQLFPLLVRALNDWAIDYISSMLTPIDNYISRSTEVFLTTADPDYRRLTFQVAEKLLGPQDVAEVDAAHGARVLHIMLQNSRGRIDEWIPSIVKLAVDRFNQGARNDLLKVLLLEVVTNSLYYNVELTLSLLEANGWTVPLFVAIFALLSDFKRAYDKKQLVLGLCPLFSLPINALPSAISSQLPQIFVSLVGILSEYVKLEAEENQDDDDEEDDDDDDDFGEDSGEELDDEEDGTEDEKYMRLLAKRAKEFEEEGEDDDGADDEDRTSPLDDVDPFVFFMHACEALKASQPEIHSQLMASLNHEQATVFQQVCVAEANKRVAAKAQSA